MMKNEKWTVSQLIQREVNEARKEIKHMNGMAQDGRTQIYRQKYIAQ